MSFSHEYNFPLFVSNGSVKTSGHSSELAPSQLMVAVEKTHQAIAGPGSKWDALKVIQGSLHKKDKLGLYYGGMKKSDESPAFLPSDILEFHKSLPRKAQNEEWVIGWDGVSTTDTLSFECGKSYRFKVKVWGEDVYGMYLRPIEREIGFTTDCCVGDDCTQTCDDTVAGKKWAKALANAVNTDPELKYFVEAEAISSDYASTTATHRLYTLSVPDDGTVMALAAVQAALGSTFVATLIGRAGIISTYQVVTVLDGGGSPVAVPADYTATAPFVFAGCDTCPAGYTLAAGSTSYVITRPLAGSEDLSTSGAQQTYANTFKTTYTPATTFNGATAVEVVAASDAITLTAHPFVTGEKVTYANGGGTSIVGLTTATDYFVIKVDANTVKLATTAANAFAGTAIAIADGVGAAHTLTSVSTATFLSQNGSTATISLKVAEGKVLTAVLSDSLELGSNVDTTCTPTSPGAISWVAGADRYKVTRTLTLTLEKECGTGNRLADLVAFYANNPEVASVPTLTTAGTCNDIYTITQYNKELLVDGCLSEDVPTFNDLTTFEGFRWTPTPAAAGSTTVKTGVRIRTAYEGGTQFSGCSFHPNDYYSVRPLKLEITDLVGGPGEFLVSPCAAIVPSKKVKYASMATQSGEYIIREFIRAVRYRVNGEYWTDPRLREVLDTVASDVIDRHKSYVIYYFKVRAHRPVVNHVADFSPEIYEFQIVAPVGVDMTALETLLSSVASQNGVALKNR